jgi:precorrin-4 methylase
MSVTNVRTRFGLSFTGTATREGASGTISIGLGNQDQRITDAAVGAVARLVIAPGKTVDWDALFHAADTADTWTVGNAQVETATAVGTASASGNITVTVTSTGMTGSPLAITVAIASGDTATQWAAKVRTALQANATIAERFTVSGSTTAIVLTRKPLATFAVVAENLSFYAANDASLNIGIAAGSTGITAASTSANTTNGVATAGFQVYGETVDFEGRTVDEMDRIYAFDIKSRSGIVVVGEGSGTGVGFTMKSGGRACFYDVTMTTLSLEALTDPVDVEFCIAGSLA